MKCSSASDCLIVKCNLLWRSYDYALIIQQEYSTLAHSRFGVPWETMSVSELETYRGKLLGGKIRSIKRISWIGTEISLSGPSCKIVSTGGVVQNRKNDKNDLGKLIATLPQHMLVTFFQHDTVCLWQPYVQNMPYSIRHFLWNYLISSYASWCILVLGWHLYRYSLLNMIISSALKIYITWIVRAYNMRFKHASSQLSHDLINNTKYNNRSVPQLELNVVVIGLLILPK